MSNDMTEPTQGPWRINPATAAGEAPVIMSDHMFPPRPIAKVLYHGGSEDPEVHANARLIAAARDLLRELENLIAACHEYEADPDNDFGAPYTDDAEAAIRKAREGK